MTTFEELMAGITLEPGLTAPGSVGFDERADTAKEIVMNFYGPDSAQEANFKDAGLVRIQFLRFGETVTTVNLFDYKELGLFAYYRANRHRYPRVVDLGANVGLHSILWSRLGAEVRAWEPDPQHCEWAQSNFALNSVSPTVRCMAASTHNGRAHFVRLLGNRTGSHLASCKGVPYGELEDIEVEVGDCRSDLDWANFAKIDIEGHEANVITGYDIGKWSTLDAAVEIGSSSSADQIWEYFEGTKINLFAQREGWRRIVTRRSMPTHHSHGTLLISAQPKLSF